MYVEVLPFLGEELLPAYQEVEEVRDGTVRTKPEKYVFSLAEYGIDLSVYGRNES